ncbi:MAG: glycosyltransferase family 2 protein [Pirellulales bacterium]|nr:glycosyltransferase family 2 protein [Pirellulales bacterium]
MTETDVVLSVIAIIACVFAAIPAALTWQNLKIFCTSPQEECLEPVSVLVPARNEERVLDGFIRNILASRGVQLELVVLDDASTDSTAQCVSQWSDRDPRVRLVHGKKLPQGWCGKQHACYQLAESARFDTLLFLDADVTVQPDAIARSVAFLNRSKVDLGSGFPHQETPTVAGWLLLPLIHFVLLGYLPLSRSRLSNDPSLAAGCGQLFITTRSAYDKAGGHAVIKSSLHDGIMLPRAFRKAGLRTDIFDASDIASCRMYETNRDVLQGITKNATEGIGAPKTIVPFTILLGGSAVAPALLLTCIFSGISQSWITTAEILFGLALSYFPRLITLNRFKQSAGSVFFHPLAVGIFLAVQWFALGRRLLGIKTSWKGRSLKPQ